MKDKRVDVGKVNQITISVNIKRIINNFTTLDFVKQSKSKGKYKNGTINQP